MDSNTRTEQMFWMKTLIRTGSAPSEFDNFIDCIEGEKFFERLPFLKKFQSREDYPDKEEVLDAFEAARATGFLIQGARPVKKSNGYYSWGHYHTAWLYASNSAEIETVLDAWAAEMEAKDKSP